MKDKCEIRNTMKEREYETTRHANIHLPGNHDHSPRRTLAPCILGGPGEQRDYWHNHDAELALAAAHAVHRTPQRALSLDNLAHRHMPTHSSVAPARLMPAATVFVMRQGLDLRVPDTHRVGRSCRFHVNCRRGSAAEQYLGGQ